MSNDCSLYYVYFVYLDDVVIYIGKGTGDRYLHATSGRSCNIKLNEIYFKSKLTGSAMPVIKIDKYFECEDDALSYERSEILRLSPECNIVFTPRNRKVSPKRGKLEETKGDRRVNNSRPIGFQGKYSMTEGEKTAFRRWRSSEGLVLSVKNPDHCKLVEEWLDARRSKS